MSVNLSHKIDKDQMSSSNQCNVILNSSIKVFILSSRLFVVYTNYNNIIIYSRTNHSELST